MKISPSRVEGFIKNIPNNVAIILLYGKDEGLIQERCAQIKASYLNNQFNDDNVINIYHNQFKENLDIISNNAFSDSLFGSVRKIIVLKQAKDSYTKFLQAYAKTHAKDTLIIAISDDLTPSSSLRKFAEKSDISYAIPSYIDTLETLRKFIYSRLYLNNYKITPDAITYLTVNLGLDRAITNNELNKLLLYKGDDKQITIADVQKVIADNSSIFIDKIHFSLFNLKIEEAYINLIRILEEETPVFVVRALANHSYRLSYALAYKNTFTNIDELIKKISPPILFLYIPKFKEQMNIWNINKIQKFANYLIKKEIEVKLNSNLAGTLLKQMFITFEKLFYDDFSN